MECNTPSKVLLTMFVILLFPLVIFITSDEKLLNKLEEYYNKNKDEIEKYEITHNDNVPYVLTSLIQHVNNKRKKS